MKIIIMLMLINIKISIAITTETRQRVYRFAAFCKEFTLLDTIRIKYESLSSTSHRPRPYGSKNFSVLCALRLFTIFDFQRVRHKPTKTKFSLCRWHLYTAWKPNHSWGDVLLILQWWNVTIYMKLDVVDLLERKYSSS